MKYAVTKFTRGNLTTLKIEYALKAILLLALVVVAKDVLHASFKSYSFYASESLLFGVFWFLFVTFGLFYPKSVLKNHFVVKTIGLSFIHLVFFSCFVSLFSYSFMDDPFNALRVFVDTTARYGIACFFIYSLFGLFVRETIDRRIEEASTKIPAKVSVMQGDLTRVIDVNDIIFIRAEKPYLSVITTERRYLQKNSLKGVLQDERTAHFVRIHRSVVINADHIVAYSSRKNGDYDIELHGGHSVRASRTYSDNFKSVFKQFNSEA